MRFVTGDECGLIKEFVPSAVKLKDKDGKNSSIITEQGIRRVNVSDRIARTNAVSGVSGMADYQQFASLRVDGSVQVWQGQYDSQKHETYRQLVDIPSVFGESRERALGLSRLLADKLCACSTAGTVVILDPLADDDTKRVVRQFAAFESRNTDSITNITAFCTQQNTGLVAVGGKDRETVVWDVNHSSHALLWKAKNLPPDPQTLLQPQVWPTAACFMSSDASDTPNILAVGTAYRQVRIYDLRMSGSSAGVLQQRRPVSYTPMDETTVLEHRVTALCGISPHELAVGDAGGDIHALDLRSMGGGAILRDTKQAFVGRFVGPAGSVRQLVKHPTANRMACVGLDRMLRIYDTKTRKQLHTVYLKQRLNCVLASGEDDINEEQGDNVDDDIDREDNVQDYIDSDNESFEDEDDVVEEMIDAMDDEDEGSSADEQAAIAPRTKRRRQ